jgi:peptide deformylase
MRDLADEMRDLDRQFDETGPQRRLDRPLPFRYGGGAELAMVSAVLLGATGNLGRPKAEAQEGDVRERGRNEDAGTIKGADRNRPCQCGSGVKAKKCACGGYTSLILKEFAPALTAISTEIVGCQELADAQPMLDRMARTLRATKTGVGLAANQIGWMKRAIVLYPNRTTFKYLLNPKVLSHSMDLTLMEEGCLSYPRLWVQVRRPESITLEYFDREHVRHVEEFEGFEARVIQHEMEHLDGKCAVGDAWRKWMAKK